MHYYNCNCKRNSTKDTCDNRKANNQNHNEEDGDDDDNVNNIISVKLLALDTHLL